MAWRVVVAALFVVGEAAIVAADFSAEDDPWATILILALPLVVGMLIGRWWALAVAVTPLLLYAKDPDVVGDLAPWYALTGSILVNVGCLALGVAARHGVERVRATKPDNQVGKPGRRPMRGHRFRVEAGVRSFPH